MTTRRRLSQPVRKLETQPPITEALRSAVIAAMRWAWARLREETNVEPMEHDEETITAAIEGLLNEVGTDGRRRAEYLRLFSAVQRSGQHRAANSIRQTPDLTFQPRSCDKGVTDLSAWCVFAECKIIGPRHPPQKYCAQGVERFASGKYAPCVSSGIMVAYVRDGRTPGRTLKPLLQGRYNTTNVRAHFTDKTLLISLHDRRKLEPPCIDIELTHLWLYAMKSEN